MREYIGLDREIVEGLGLIPCGGWRIDQYDEAQGVVVYSKDCCPHVAGACYPKECPPYYSSDLGLASSLFESMRAQLDKIGAWDIRIPRPNGTITVSFIHTCGLLSEYGAGETLPLALARAGLAIIKEIRGAT